MLATGIPEFEPGTHFWNAPKRLQDGCLVVDGANFLGEPSLGHKLYIRDGYNEMSQEIADDHRVVITGTPGIGKSTFALLLSGLASVGQSASAEVRMRRSEERRVGQECVRKCRSRWSP